jgi:ferredoxin-like protein FixX
MNGSSIKDKRDGNMSNKPKKYSRCPLCFGELKKTPLTKRTYECLECGLKIFPNKNTNRKFRKGSHFQKYSYVDAKPKINITNDKIKAWLRG